MSPQDFASAFRTATGHEPHRWQGELAADASCRDRLIRIPTGLGKTAGTAIAWLWHRVLRSDDAWPRRLVFCLPMRVLVEQTEKAIRDWITTLGCKNVAVHRIMGGSDAAQ